MAAIVTGLLVCGFIYVIREMNAKEEDLERKM